MKACLFVWTLGTGKRDLQRGDCLCLKSVAVTPYMLPGNRHKNTGSSLTASSTWMMSQPKAIMGDMHHANIYQRVRKGIGQCIRHTKRCGSILSPKPYCDPVRTLLASPFLSRTARYGAAHRPTDPATPARASWRPGESGKRSKEHHPKQMTERRDPKDSHLI